MTEKFEYVRLNLMKFICSFFVIAIHTQPLFNLSWRANFLLVNVMSRIAVPFFLITSGFFLYPKLIGVQVNSIKRYVMKLLSLYVVWSVIYVFFNIPAYFSGRSLLLGSAHLMRNFLFTSVDVHLWYLLACGVGVYLIYIILKYLSWGWLTAISTVFYMTVLLSQTYFGLIDETVIGALITLYERVFGAIGNSFLMTVPFIVLGMSIRRYDLIHKIRYAMPLGVIFFILMVVEHFGLRLLEVSADYGSSISLILGTLMLFIYLAQQDEMSQPMVLVKYSTVFQEASLVIYTVHILFLRLLYMVYGYFGIDNPRLLTFLILSLCSILTFILMKKTKRGYQILMNPHFIGRKQKFRREFT